MHKSDKQYIIVQVWNISYPRQSAHGFWFSRRMDWCMNYFFSLLHLNWWTLNQPGGGLMLMEGWIIACQYLIMKKRDNNRWQTASTLMNTLLSLLLVYFWFIILLVVYSYLPPCSAAVGNEHNDTKIFGKLKNANIIQILLLLRLIDGIAFSMDNVASKMWDCWSVIISICILAFRADNFLC